MRVCSKTDLNLSKTPKMRRRDTSLQAFVQKHGTSNPREIKKLKRKWRRRYQNQWQRQKRKSQNEIRFSVTKDEYQSIKSKAVTENATPTEWSKEIVLALTAQLRSIPEKSKLYEVLRKLGLAINRLISVAHIDEAKSYLLEAESVLEDYLHSKD